MNLDYLVKCAKYKYKPFLDRGELEAPTAQEEQSLALRADINTLKARTSKGGAGKRQHQGNTKPLTGNQTHKKGKGKVKRDFSWQLVPHLKDYKPMPEPSGERIPMVFNQNRSPRLGLQPLGSSQTFRVIGYFKGRSNPR